MDFWGDERLCALDGAINFRDIGGYRAGDSVVRTRRIYRAGMLTHLADASLDGIAVDLGIRTIVDLRAAGELALGLPDYGRVGLRHVHIPIGDVQLPEDEQRARWEEMRAGTLDWAKAYQTLIAIDGSGFAKVIETVAEPAALPAVIHCAAGRDRTGVTIALILGALGVSNDDIASDYSLSGDALGDNAHRFLSPAEMSDEAIAFFRMATATPADTMHRFLDWLVAEHGSIAGALTAIGVGDDTIASLRRELLQPV